MARVSISSYQSYEYTKLTMSSGAVFTRDGINELEASIMVSRGKKKRGVGVMGLRHVKNPIKLAREMLIRGEDDLEGGNGEHRGPMLADGLYKERSGSSGAQGHDQLYGEGAERLAKTWGLEVVDPSYFFVQNRWDEHVKGLDREKDGSGLAFYDTVEFVPQGTCGAVAMDADGMCAAATSTGGMTNKLTGRIGDTPTLGAGFWAEEWQENRPLGSKANGRNLFAKGLNEFMADCLPSLAGYDLLEPSSPFDHATNGDKIIRSTAMSGTGNGDSFLRLNAVRTVSAIARYRGDSLQDAITEITGPGGDLQKSAGNRWKKTGEGEGGIIGIECTVVKDKDGRIKSTVSHVVDEFNCGGMFRATVNKEGKAICRVWRPGQHERLEEYAVEGQEYNVEEWLSEKGRS